MVYASVPGGEGGPLIVQPELQLGSLPPPLTFVTFGFGLRLPTEIPAESLVSATETESAPAETKFGREEVLLLLLPAPDGIVMVKVGVTYFEDGPDPGGVAVGLGAGPGTFVPPPPPPPPHAVNATTVTSVRSLRM
jgi:hypothetical protein